MRCPVGACDVCGKGIYVPRRGVVLGDAFIERLRQEHVDEHLYEVMSTGPEAPFVQAVTYAGIVQLEALWADVTDNARSVPERGAPSPIMLLRELSNPISRIHFLFSRPIPTKDVYLLAHIGCVPPLDDAPRFQTDLPGIDTPDKADTWQRCLSRLPTWNPHGWSILLSKLFG